MALCAGLLFFQDNVIAAAKEMTEVLLLYNDNKTWYFEKNNYL